MGTRTRMFSRAFAYALIAPALAVGSAPVRAATVTVTAQGTIAPSCSMTSTKNFGSANINAAGTATATASVTCNQFFKMNATSANGAIKMAASVPAPYTNSLPYSLKGDIGLDNGTTSSVTCASSTLVAGQSSCALSPANSTGLTSGGQIATGKTTTLTMSWTPPAPPTFLKPGGSYSDSITLTVSVVP